MIRNFVLGAGLLAAGCSLFRPLPAPPPAAKVEPPAAPALPKPTATHRFEIDAASGDQRRLGVCVSRLQIDGVEAPLDGAAFAACTSPVTRTGLALGPHTFAVRQIAAAGVASAPATRAWRIDLNFQSGPVGTNHPSVAGAINPQLAVNVGQPVTVTGRGKLKPLGAVPGRMSGLFMPHFR